MTHKSSSVLAKIATWMTAAVSSAGDSVVLHGQGRRKNFPLELAFEGVHSYQPQCCFEKNLVLQERGQMLQ